MAYSMWGAAPPPPIPGYGPRQPQTVIPGMTSRTVIPAFHTFTPAKGGWTLPKGTTLGYTPLKGYYARPGGAGAPAAATPAKAAAATDPITRLMNTLYGQIETPAQQEARVNREVDTQIKAQQALIDNEYARQRADALAQYQAQAAAGQAAAAMSKDLFGAVGGEYNAAAGEMKGLAHGLSKNAQGATAGDVSKANAALSSLGNAPVAEGGLFGIGGGTQQGVEEYRGGTLPGQMFSTQGEAANFGLAGMINSDNLRATQEANAALMTATHDINEAQSKAISALAAGRADLAHTYLNDARDAQVKSISLIQGLLAQKQATATAQASAAYKNAQLGLSAGRLKVSVAGLQARIKNQNFQQTMAQVKEQRVAGNQAFNQKATLQRLTQSAAQAAIANGQVNIPLSKAKGILYDKSGQPMIGADGKTISSKALLKGATAKTLTPAQTIRMQQNAETMADKFFYGTKTDTKTGKAVPASQVGGFDPNDETTWGKNPVAYTSALRQMIRSGVKEPVARASLNALYERGNSGRPFFSQQEKAVIAKKLGLTHYRGLLNTLNRLNNQANKQKDPVQQKRWTDEFDNLIRQTLANAGLA